MGKAAAVVMDGPFADQDPESGDEIPSWGYNVVDEDGDDITEAKHGHYYEGVRAEAQALAKRLGVEFVNDGSPA